VSRTSHDGSMWGPPIFTDEELEELRRWQPVDVGGYRYRLCHNCKRIISVNGWSGSWHDCVTRSSRREERAAETVEDPAGAGCALAIILALPLLLGLCWCCGYIPIDVLKLDSVNRDMDDAYSLNRSHDGPPWELKP